MMGLPVAPTPLYLTGDRAELERLRTIADALASVGEVEVRSRALEHLAQPRQRPNPFEGDDLVERLRALFTLVRRAGIVWILWPEALPNECVVGSLAYALAHRWHVGARMHVVTSGPTVGASALALLADFAAVDDAAALEHCIRRVRPSRTSSHRFVRAKP